MAQQLRATILKMRAGRVDALRNRDTEFPEPCRLPCTASRPGMARPIKYDLVNPEIGGSILPEIVMTVTSSVSSECSVSRPVQTHVPVIGRENTKKYRDGDQDHDDAGCSEKAPVDHPVVCSVSQKNCAYFLPERLPENTNRRWNLRLSSRRTPKTIYIW